MTEVVNLVVRRFFGEEGVKAIASSNSEARLLAGKTMHAAGKMSRGQSLKAKKLKPNSRAKEHWMPSGTGYSCCWLMRSGKLRRRFSRVAVGAPPTAAETS